MALVLQCSVDSSTKSKNAVCKMESKELSRDDVNRKAGMQDQLVI